MHVKKISFVVRELCELYALVEIINHFVRSYDKLICQVIISKVNTDFDHIDPINFLISRSSAEFLSVDINDVKEVYGFSATGKRHENDDMVVKFFDVSSILATRIITRKQLFSKKQRPIIVVGNTKIQYPFTDIQYNFLSIAKTLPYHFIWVPRHPVVRELASSVANSLPNNFELNNKLGVLANLQSSADLTIMGRMLSPHGMDDTEHNPFEATSNSFTICGKLNNIKPAYEWIFYESGLVSICNDDPLQLFDFIPKLLKDKSLESKLDAKNKWIEQWKGEIFKHLKEVVFD